ncbi:MAG: redoxin domain-containing protein [Spirochaetes bacterium]|nr:redoxin domain-containing protein [Spirochaetota bacterium]
MNKLKIGDMAPDFTLKNQDDKEISLSSLKGKKVLVSFHPLAWTSVCEIQMRTLENKKRVFDGLNTVALGVSVDSVPSKSAWAKSIGIEKTDLLADFWPHGDVAKKFDMFIEKAGISGRANILIDENGIIESIRVYEIPEVPDIEAVIRSIKKQG